jgi:hypothetical protein
MFLALLLLMPLSGSFIELRSNDHLVLFRHKLRIAVYLSRPGIYGGKDSILETDHGTKRR